MNTVATVAELRDQLDLARAQGLSIGLVPTMGALHEGHLSLIDRSVAENGLTVVTVFVNPTQFRPGEDLDAYPRQLERDAALAAERGAGLLFTPSVEEVYPDGFSTGVTVRGITETLCGAPEHRGHEHFDGVTTVVAKLFNMVGADRAYFGQKDAQQVAVIRRMARDLDFRVEIVACPTVREADGLAMSSRNAYLSEDERARALSLSRALRAAADGLAAGVTDAGELRQLALAELDEVDSVDYFEIVDPDTLSPLLHVRGPALAAVAAHVGGTRLIDNTLLTATASPGGAPRPGSAGAHSPSKANPTSQGAVI